MFNFTPERDALNFGPRHHQRWRERQFLLWPAWAYRVVAPRSRRRPLNLLQRAIMGLCRIGVHRVDPIAEHLALHRDLVAFILTELSGLGYLDQYGLPSRLGKKAMEEDAVEADEMVAGYVFQDPWNGELWPRFVDSLTYCALDYNKGEFPSVVLGTTGKPKRYPTFTVLPRTMDVPSPPSPATIVRAVSQHRRDLRYGDAEGGEEEWVGEYAASGVRISRVSFVEDEPEAVFLLTYLYVPESDAGAMDWYACDPFGLGQSTRLRRRVEAVMHEDESLFDVVRKLVGKKLHGSYEDHHTWFKDIHLKAELEVDHQLTVNFREHDCFDQVVQLEAARLEMRELGRQCPPRKVDDVLRAGVKVLEAVFASLTQAYPLRDVWKRVYVSRVDRRNGHSDSKPQPDRRVCRATYHGAFTTLGFSEPIPPSFLNVKPGQIKAVAQYDDSWRLRPLITATALLAQQEPAHPLAQAAKAVPDLLNAIEAVARLGGSAGHAQSKAARSEQAVTLEQAEQHVEQVYEIVRRVLMPSTAPKNQIEISGELHG